MEINDSDMSVRKSLTYLKIRMIRVLTKSEIRSRKRLLKNFVVNGCAEFVVAEAVFGITAAFLKHTY